MKQAKRFKKHDWLELAHKQIAAEGDAGLTVERLCEVANRTRGSFYHHFASHEEFIVEMMLLWVEKQTSDLITKTENIPEPVKRLKALGSLATSIDYKLEVAIRLFAQNHKDAAGILQKVDNERVSYLQHIYSETRLCNQKTAEHIARIEYAAFVGTMILWPETAMQDSGKLDSLFRDMVLGYLETRQTKSTADTT